VGAVGRQPAAVKVRGDPRRRMCKRISDLYARQMADKREMQEAGTRSAGQSAAGGSARTSVSPGSGVALSLSWSWAIRASSTPFRSGRRWIKGANSFQPRPGHRPRPPRGGIAEARVEVYQRAVRGGQGARPGSRSALPVGGLVARRMALIDRARWPRRAAARVAPRQSGTGCPTLIER
jgi:hypothetical protein